MDTKEELRWHLGDAEYSPMPTGPSVIHLRKRNEKKKQMSSGVKERLISEATVSISCFDWQYFCSIFFAIGPVANAFRDFPMNGMYGEVSILVFGI